MGTISRIGSAIRPAPQPEIGVWRRALALFSLWRLRAAQRRQLAEIAVDPRMLRDIGLTPYDAAQEIRKQFWRS
jgi:uncharacterized protein YjiS (DUF1127 family)